MSQVIFSDKLCPNEVESLQLSNSHRGRIALLGKIFRLD